jgi:hypothetical protein
LASLLLDRCAVLDIAYTVAVFASRGVAYGVPCAESNPGFAYYP